MSLSSPEHGMNPERELDSQEWLTRLRTIEDERAVGTIGRFEILGEIGRGGQGIVYRAIHPDTGGLVAVKRLLLDGRGLGSVHLKLERERKTVGSLSHPGIVQIHEIESDGDQPLLVMEWIDGLSPTEWAWSDVERKSAREIAAAVAAICGILLHAHQKGIIHRDLKPSNILIDRENKPHLLDFGLAKSLNEEPVSLAMSIGTSGPFVGTLAYASPEVVARGTGAIDARSDVYAMGVILYEMLAGRLPYELGDSISDAVDAIVRSDPPGLKQFGVDAKLEAIVLSALAKSVHARYQSADALLTDLQHYLNGEPVQARGPGLWESVVRLGKKHPMTSAVAGLVAVALLGFGVTMTVLYERSQKSAEQAQRIRSFLGTALGDATGAGGDGVPINQRLDKAAVLASSEFANDPIAEAKIRNHLSRRYSDRFQWLEAETQSAIAVSLLEQSGLTNDPEYVMALTQLGLARSYSFSSRSDSLLLRAVTIEAARATPDAKVMGRLYSELGQLHWSVHIPPDFESAEQEFQKGFEWFETSGEPNREWVIALQGYAQMCKARGRSSEAVAAFRLALDKSMDLSDDTLDNRTRLLENIGDELSRISSYEESERAYRRALEIRDGVSDLRVPPTESKLGTVIMRQGRPEEALEYFHKAMISRFRLLAAELPESKGRYASMISAVESGGLQPEEVLPIGTLLIETAPNIYPLFQHTSGEVAKAYRVLSKPELAKAIDGQREALAESIALTS